MTPEERLKQNLAAYMARMGQEGLDINAPPITMDSQVEKLVNAPMSSGMMSSYIDQAEAANRQSNLDARTQDLTGMENQIKNQRRYAESLRGREMPRGQSVGPLDVYVQPNWGETLQGALNPVIGGLINREANRNEAEASTKRSALNKAQAQYDAEVLERQETRKDRILNEQITNNLRDDTYREARDVIGDKRYASKEAKEEAIRLEAKALAAEKEATRKAERIEDYERELAAGRLTQEQKIELETLKAELKNGGFSTAGLSAVQAGQISRLQSAGERTTANMLVNTSRDLQELTAEAQALLEANPDANWSSAKVGLASDVAENFPLIGGDTLRNMAKSAGYNDDEKKIRSMSANAVESFRRARTGANLTGVEIKVGEDWDPTAPGIGPEESLRRTIELNNTVNQYLSTMGVSPPSYAEVGADADTKAGKSAPAGTFADPEEEAAYQAWLKANPEG